MYDCQGSEGGVINKLAAQVINMGRDVGRTHANLKWYRTQVSEQERADNAKRELEQPNVEERKAIDELNGLQTD